MSSQNTVKFADAELTHLRSILKQRAEPSQQRAPASESSLTDDQLQERIKFLELQEELNRVKWQREEADSRVAEAARKAEEEAVVARALARRRLLAAGLALGALLVLLLAAVVVAGAVIQYVRPVHSERLWALVLLVSIGVYLLAIVWTLWSAVDGQLYPPN
jgi:cation transport ATPase